jgi:hypothetical protein
VCGLQGRTLSWNGIPIVDLGNGEGQAVARPTVFSKEVASSQKNGEINQCLLKVNRSNLEKQRKQP